MTAAHTAYGDETFHPIAVAANYTVQVEAVSREHATRIVGAALALVGDVRVTDHSGSCAMYIVEFERGVMSDEELHSILAA